MIEELKNRVITRYEVLEPWSPAPSGQADGTPAFGALAIHTHEQVLLIASALRFSAARTKAQMHVTVLTPELWAMNRTTLVEISERVGGRHCRWYQQNAHGTHGTDASPFLPLPVGESIEDIDFDGLQRTTVSLQFSRYPEAIEFRLRPDLDGAIAWETAGTRSPLKTIEVREQGEFAWLHPGALIPVAWRGEHLKSLLYEHWPLALRRDLLAQLQEHTCTDSAAAPIRHKHFMGSATLRQAYLAQVKELWLLRLAQHPPLQTRLAALAADACVKDDLGGVLSSWISQARPTLPCMLSVAPTWL